MIDSLKNMFGLGPKVNYKELIANGAIILDVRTREEYEGGHVNGSLNIPLDQLGSNIKKFRDKDQPIITCCASGMRSGSAKLLLLGKGFTKVHNGGSWRNLKEFEKK